MVDGRGAITSYVYNDPRGLLTNINYSVPNGSTIPTGSNVSFAYDGLGNRTLMTDGLGTVSYDYNQLSQMTAEERHFTDTLADHPIANNGNYRIEYAYTLSGQLKSLTDPFGQKNTYKYDKNGHLSQVLSNGYGDLSSNQPVVSNMQYRAFGSLKQADYGNGTHSLMQYNDRLEPAAYRLTNGTQILFGKDYFYTTGTNNDNDGLIKHSVHYDDSLTTTERSKKDRTNTYDAFGRITKADSGETGITPVQFGSEMTHGPFQQKFWYNEFNKLTEIDDRDFETNVIGCVGCPRGTNYHEAFVNNRTTSSSYGAGGIGGGISTYVYDQDGRLITRGSETYQYNAAGQRISADMTGTDPDPAYTYDGDGKQVKFSENGTVKNYYIFSSLLKVSVSDLTGTGALDKGYMLSPTGSRLASMKNNETIFIHNDPSGSNEYTVKMDKTTDTKFMLDPIGRYPSNGGYTGGGPCGNNCIAPYNPPGGFDGLNALAEMQNAEWLQSNEFWVLQSANESNARNRERAPLNIFILPSNLHNSNQSALPEDDFADLPFGQQLYIAVDQCAQSMFGVSLIGGKWAVEGKKTAELKFKPLPGHNVMVYSNNFWGNFVGHPVEKAFSAFVERPPDNTNGLTGSATNGIYSNIGTQPGIYFAESNNGSAKNNWSNHAYMKREINQPTSRMRLGAYNVLANPYIAVQIHETGNILAGVTGKYIKAHNWTDPAGNTHVFGDPDDPGGEGDDDTGQAFEQCVYEYIRFNAGLDK
jgi:YD repeat-containing protein